MCECLFTMLKTALLLTHIEFVRSKNMEPFIVGGKEIDISLASHSVFLVGQIGEIKYACGASILNQNILLSAAHCFEDFDSHTEMTARAGNSNKMQGSARKVNRVLIHRNYDVYYVVNDIALAYITEPFHLGSHIKRVAVMKDPPKAKVAYLAGWGVADGIKKELSNVLKGVEQPLWSRDECKKILGNIPQGILCGGAVNGKGYAAEGDSGSALIINDYIQIGLASFKRPEFSNSVVVYTDLSYFYQWIFNGSKLFHCKNKDI